MAYLDNGLSALYLFICSSSPVGSKEVGLDALSPAATLLLP